MLENAIHSGNKIIANNGQKLRGSQEDFSKISNLFRIYNLNKLKNLSQKDPDSLEYKNVLKIKRNYIYDSYVHAE